jgi:tRNA(fMet)-specific endonuclease VapC
MQYLEVIPLSEAVLKCFGALKVDLRRAGYPLPDFDLLIAGAALATDRILVTNNMRHYERIPDLRLDNWLTAG